MESVEVQIEAMNAEAPFAVVKMRIIDKQECLRIFKDDFLRVYKLLGRDARIAELSSFLDCLRTHRLSVTDGRHQESCERYDLLIEKVTQEYQALTSYNEVEFPATNTLTLHRHSYCIRLEDRAIITKGDGRQLEVIDSFDELNHLFIPVVGRLLGTDKVCRTGKHGRNIFGKEQLPERGES